MGETLARVVDTDSLASCAGPRGRITIEVPEAWQGAEIDVAVPSRVPCARCDGGGCDGCERRGGYRIPGDAAFRTLRITLPKEIGDGVILRFVEPFLPQDGAPLAQLLVEARCGQNASTCVTRVPAPMLIQAPQKAPFRVKPAALAAVAASTGAAGTAGGPLVPCRAAPRDSHGCVPHCSGVAALL